MAHVNIPTSALNSRPRLLAKLAEHDTALNALETTGTGDPSRVLHVAQSWPVGVNSLTHFTTISAALTQAATLTPTSPNQVVIVISPGTYSAALTLVSNVALIGHAAGTVVISGAVSWLPGQGVNASSIAAAEDMLISQIKFSGQVTIDSTAKTASVASFIANRSVTKGITAVTKVADEFLFFNHVFLKGTVTDSFTDTTLVLGASRMRWMSFAGACNVLAEGCQVFFVTAQTHVFAGTSVGKYVGCHIDQPITVASGCSVSIPGSFLNRAFTIASGGTGDARGANYLTSANLAGAGTVLADNNTTAPATLSGAGTLDLTKRTTLLTTTGAAQAVVLPNGNFSGQQITVVHSVDGGSAVITPTTAGNFANVTLTNVWESVTFEWSATAWNVIRASPVAIVA